MISLKKRNVTVLTEDEITVVSGGSDTDPRNETERGCGETDFTCYPEGYTATPECFEIPDTDGCPSD